MRIATRLTSNRFEIKIATHANGLHVEYEYETPKRTFYIGILVDGQKMMDVSLLQNRFKDCICYAPEIGLDNTNTATQTTYNSGNKFVAMNDWRHTKNNWDKIVGRFEGLKYEQKVKSELNDVHFIINRYNIVYVDLHDGAEYLTVQKPYKDLRENVPNEYTEFETYLRIRGKYIINERETFEYTTKQPWTPYSYFWQQMVDIYKN